MIGEGKEKWLLASDAGYGFVGELAAMQTKNRNGKALVTLPKGSRLLPPVPVSDPEHQWVAVVSNEGRLLVFPLKQLPELGRGKGNKLIDIPAARVANREEFVQALAVLAEADTLVVYAGKRHLKIKGVDLAHYHGERGRRGHKLPRGFQKVDRLEVQGKEGD